MSRVEPARRSLRSEIVFGVFAHIGTLLYKSVFAEVERHGRFMPGKPASLRRVVEPVYPSCSKQRELSALLTEAAIVRLACITVVDDDLIVIACLHRLLVRGLESLHNQLLRAAPDAYLAYRAWLVAWRMPEASPAAIDCRYRETSG